MSLAQEVLDILVDPTDRQALQYLEAESVLYNERLRVKYAVNEKGIAILLADSAVAVSNDEHERLTALVAAGRATATGNRAQKTSST